MKFSSLKAGTYRYRVYAHLNENRVVTLMNQTFEVKESASAAGIVSKALEFAWPRGTSEGTLDYGSGHPKVDYVKIAYPGKGGNGQVSRGASCDGSETFMRTPESAAGLSATESSEST